MGGIIKQNKKTNERRTRQTIERIPPHHQHRVEKRVKNKSKTILMPSAHSTHVSLSAGSSPLRFFVFVSHIIPTEVLPCVWHCRIYDVDDVQSVEIRIHESYQLQQSVCLYTHLYALYTRQCNMCVNTHTHTRYLQRRIEKEKRESKLVLPQKLWSREPGAHLIQFIRNLPPERRQK